MKASINGLIRLTRYREYLSFVVVSTSLGAIAAYGQFSWQLGVVLLANELAVAFAFMINDVEDAADDALDAAKAKRNPVSAGMISYRAAYIASFIVAVLSAALYALLGMGPFVIGTACLLIAFLYSWRPVRLKSIPFVDLVSHALMLAGLQFAAAYFTFSSTLGPRFFWLFLMSIGISAYGELFNELRDLEGDKRAGVTHTASVLGPRAARLSGDGLLGDWILRGIRLDLHRADGAAVGAGVVGDQCVDSGPAAIVAHAPQGVIVRGCVGAVPQTRGDRCGIRPHRTRSRPMGRLDGARCHAVVLRRVDSRTAVDAAADSVVSVSARAAIAAVLGAGAGDDRGASGRRPHVQESTKSSNKPTRPLRQTK